MDDGHCSLPVEELVPLTQKLSRGCATQTEGGCWSPTRAACSPRARRPNPGDC